MTFKKAKRERLLNMYKELLGKTDWNCPFWEKKQNLIRIQILTKMADVRRRDDRRLAF